MRNNKSITFYLRGVVNPITWYDGCAIYLTGKLLDGAFEEKCNIIRRDWTMMPMNNIIQFYRLDRKEGMIEFRIVDIIYMEFDHYKMP